MTGLIRGRLAATFGAGTAARVRVVIESSYGSDTWGTVGVSENLIEASWIALVDSINYMLTKYNIKEKRQ